MGYLMRICIAVISWDQMIHKTNICIRQVFINGIFKENFILGVVVVKIVTPECTAGFFQSVAISHVLDCGWWREAFCRGKSCCQIEDSATHSPVDREGLPRLLPENLGDSFTHSVAFSFESNLLPAVWDISETLFCFLGLPGLYRLQLLE